MLEGLVVRRVSGEPLETVLGWVEFAGMRLAVGPGVFVPRRRTELLAHTAVRLARATTDQTDTAGGTPHTATEQTGTTDPTPPTTDHTDTTDPTRRTTTGRAPRPTTGAVVVEACCGVGPVAAVVARDVPGADVHAVDVDPVATAWAARNLAGRGRVWNGDLLDPLPAALRGRVDVLVANAPYVPSAAVVTMPTEARRHEPLVALDGGSDGADVQRRLLAAAPAWVAPGGHVLVETSRRQVPLTRAACPPGWAVEVLHDEDVDATVVVARRPVRPT